mgnify:CR=1 FL=1
MSLKIEQRLDTFFTETEPRIYTTGAHVVPMQIEIGKKQRYVWIVDEFSDGSYLDGKCCNPVVYADNAATHYFILSYEMVLDGRKADKNIYRCKHYKILSLESLSLDVKYEFNSDNQRMYSGKNGTIILDEGEVR